MALHHLTIAGEAWCDWTGSIAGQAINAKAGGVCCSHATLTAARTGAKALRPHFKRGRVRIVEGECPQALAAVQTSESRPDRSGRLFRARRLAVVNGGVYHSAACLVAAR